MAAECSGLHAARLVRPRFACRLLAQRLPALSDTLVARLVGASGPQATLRNGQNCSCLSNVRCPLRHVKLPQWYVGQHERRRRPLEKLWMVLRPLLAGQLGLSMHSFPAALSSGRRTQKSWGSLRLVLGQRCFRRFRMPPRFFGRMWLTLQLVLLVTNMV